MGKFLIRIVINGVAIWLTTLIVAGVHVTTYDDGILPTVVTYLVVGLVFGIVNAIIGTLIRIVAFPLYILTLGLISFIVNGILLLITAGVTSWFGFGLTIDGFWWGVLGALVLGIINWIFGAILKPQLNEGRR
jgi:putative membrane protein